MRLRTGEEVTAQAWENCLIGKLTMYAYHHIPLTCKGRTSKSSVLRLRPEFKLPEGIKTADFWIKLHIFRSVQHRNTK
jgi:hypothetical protein